MAKQKKNENDKNRNAAAVRPTSVAVLVIVAVVVSVAACCNNSSFSNKNSPNVHPKQQERKQQKQQQQYLQQQRQQEQQQQYWEHQEDLVRSNYNADDDDKNVGVLLSSRSSRRISSNSWMMTTKRMVAKQKQAKQKQQHDYYLLQQQEQQQRQQQRQQQKRRQQTTTTVVETVPLIIGGSQVVAGAYPWFASTGPTGSFWCGASLIAADFLVTAIHCSPAFPIGGDIIVGAYKFRDPAASPNSVVVKVLERIPHPDFTANPKLLNDIMLIRIDPPIFNIVPIALSTDASFPPPPFLERYDESSSSPSASSSTAATNLTIMGFGYTQAGGPTSDYLQEAQVNALNTTACVEMYGLDNNLYSNGNILCAEGRTPDRMACGGDSGGPVIGYPNGDDAAPVLLGVGSIGARNCPDGPTIFTRVSQYVSNFLRPNICEQSTDGLTVSQLGCPLTPLSCLQKCRPCVRSQDCCDSMVCGTHQICVPRVRSAERSGKGAHCTSTQSVVTANQ